jgi:endonuclease YncB( thermonuclease family)
VELLKAGLAKMADRSLQYTSAAHAGAMRAAERTAKAARLRLWATYEAPVIRGEREFDGKVIEAVSGDTLAVLLPPRVAGGLGEERRVSLASVRAPRMGNPRREEKDAPWAWEVSVVCFTVCCCVDYGAGSGAAAPLVVPPCHCVLPAAPVCALGWFRQRDMSACRHAPH